MKEERLFLAIGAADPALLERSCRRTHSAVRWGLLAACLALSALLAYQRLSPEPPPEGDPLQPPDVLTFAGSDTDILHLEAICYGAEETNDFFLYINEERYNGAWEDGSYVIRPVTPTPEGLPECDLTITHWRDISLEEAAEVVRAKMEETYSMVLPPEEQTDRIVLSAYNGTESGAEWDAANARVTVISDQEGGVFTLTARFFTEAAEGIGAGMAGMAESFQPIPADLVVPDWLKSLREALDTLLSAAFSNDWAEAGELLAEGAQISGYQEDVSGQVTVSAVDISPDDGEAPASAAVSVRHRLSAEEPYVYLTIELSRIGGQWKAGFIGLER